MSQARSFFSTIRWDIAVELRRRESTINMCLFALLMLFIGSYAVSEKEILTGSKTISLQTEFGPIFFWVSVFFAGTIGIGRSFLAERENGALHGILVSPVDPGVFYLAKVASTWIYALVMGTLMMVAYVVLFDFSDWGKLGDLFLVTAAFLLAYVSPGTLMSAMTIQLRGGEVVLRVLLFPLMVPAIMIALEANEGIFDTSTIALGSPLATWKCAVALLAMAAIYLCVCFLLFPYVVEE